MKILIVDRQIRAGRTVAGQVMSMGHEAAIAWTAADAIEAAAEWIPDAALLDIELGENDGHEVCRILRSNPDLSRCKIIALSGTSTLDFLALSLFDAILEKPVDAPMLVSLLGSGSDDSSGEG
ncbi:response regulator [Paraburkholderia sp. DD10]|uniref:response regulator n=1 Tax=Paraburkholderia sp. DD10 TaxID=3409691 RepID=UPI003B9DDD4C